MRTFIHSVSCIMLIGLATTAGPQDAAAQDRRSEPAAAASEHVLVLALPEMALGEALKRIALQSGVSLFFASDELPSLNVSLPHGRYTVVRALELVLSGTGFAARPAGSNGFSIIRSLAEEPGRRHYSLNGTVSDAETGAPLAGANVFLANSTRGSATGAAGFFIITDVGPGTYELVASMVGYEPSVRTISVDTNTEWSGFNFLLQPQTYELLEIAVSEERSPVWQKQLRNFTRLFVGTTGNARETSILNPHVLDFETTGNVTRAIAREPLLIENRSLGYRITFVMTAFYWNRREGILRYHGRPLFESLQPEDDEEEARWIENRVRAYRGSLQHLLRSLIEGRAEEEGFMIYKRHATSVRGEERVADPGDILVPGGSHGSEFSLRFQGYLLVTYRKRDDQNLLGFTVGWPWRSRVSRIYVSDHPGHIDASGYVHGLTGLPAPLQVTGDMGNQRMADRLPREFAIDDF